MVLFKWPPSLSYLHIILTSTSKCLNPPKSSFRKLHPKTILIYHTWVNENKLVWCGQHKIHFCITDLSCNIPFSKNLNGSPPSLAIYVPCTNNNNLLSKNWRRFRYQQSIIICIRMKSVYLLPDGFLWCCQIKILTEMFC